MSLQIFGTLFSLLSALPSSPACLANAKTVEVPRVSPLNTLGRRQSSQRHAYCCTECLSVDFSTLSVDFSILRLGALPIDSARKTEERGRTLFALGPGATKCDVAACPLTLWQEVCAVEIQFWKRAGGRILALGRIVRYCFRHSVAKNF